METKKCTLCKKTKLLSDFYRGARRDGRQSECKVCKSLYYKEWYKKHTPQQKRVVRERQKYYIATNQQKIREYFLTHPCVDCGETDPIVLDFDHVRGRKRSNVSGLVGCNWRVIEREIAKCEVRCANDHRRVTAKRREMVL